MTQDILALIIVFLAVGYVVFSIIRSLRVKKQSKCGSCNGCSFAELAKEKSIKACR